MIHSISNSDDLAEALNAGPLTYEDAMETPRDWLDGIWVGGTVYPLDPDATTTTLAVLADGTAAARLTSDGEHCEHPYHNRYRGHWCPASTDCTEWGEARGVERDWRRVCVWDSNGYADTTVYTTLDEAKAAFTREEHDLDQIAHDAREEVRK